MTFFILFYQYHFVVGLLINAHESGSSSPGAGTFSRDLTKTKSLQYRILPWLCIWENQYPRYSPALGVGGDMVANDWCIMAIHLAPGKRK